MAVPHQSLDGVRFVIGDFDMDGRLVAAGRVELVRFTGRAVFVAGLYGDIGRCVRGLFDRCVGRKGFLAMRMFRRLEDDLLVHLFEVIPAHTEFVHGVLFYSTPKNLRMPLAASTNAWASSTEL